MPRDERREPRLRWHRDEEQPPAILVPAVLAAAASFVAVWQYTAVIAPGAWSFTVVAVVIVIALVGIAVRTLLRARAGWVRESTTLLAQLAASVGAVTLLIAGDTAFFGLVPTPLTLSTFGTLAASAQEQIIFGSAPLDSSPGLRLVMGLGFAVVGILLDHLVAQRGAVLASLLTAAVGAAPMIVTLSGADVVWFVLLGVMVLLLFRFTARRHPESPQRSSTGIAIAAGAAAVAAALVVAPVIPVSATLEGSGIGVTVDASLRLGDDLRQPNPVEVLTIATAGDAAPYLRLTTLSQFDGRVWEPDRGDLEPLGDGFGPAEWDEAIATKTQQTSIRILRMSSDWLPVPYPAVKILGVGSSWRAMPENRTVVSRTADAVGNDYTVSSARVTPTLEQIRAVSAAEPVVDPDAEPLELPEVISQTAAEVTADASTDYDRLIALQDWFRAEFSYSLETPVEQDFDGTGADAVAKFLDVKSGYCVHFAGAFALMAQSLGMDTRIVVGYLPGTRTEDKRGDESVFSVSSDQLHSWPEVLFPGIGWVPFEPTASLGVPTAFVAAATTGGSTGGSATPAPTSTPRATSSSGPEVERGDTGDSAASSGELRRLDPTPVALIAVGVLLVLLLPAIVRTALRALRRGRARRGDAAAAWAEVRATLIDLRIPVSDADSPRARAAMLVAQHRVDATAMRTLTDAVERMSYARSSDRGDLAAELGSIVGGLHRSVDGAARVRALLLPRSLFAGRGAEASLLA